MEEYGIYDYIKKSNSTVPTYYVTEDDFNSVKGKIELVGLSDMLIKKLPCGAVIVRNGMSDERIRARAQAERMLVPTP